MGVLGLWQLLGPVGQPVSLESLENKILAVDISIWLNQAVKGYRDAKGGSVANAHLLSLFSRLCKLLFYKIRPIIVFDGGVPELKKQTIINRQHRRSTLKSSSNEANLKILANFAASQGLDRSSTSSHSNFVTSKSSAKEDIYVLPPLEDKSESLGEEIDDIEFKHDISTEDVQYLNDIDIESKDFDILPVEIKQEILSTLKERRKHKTWEHFESLPKESDEFSSYQMQCLLKRRRIQNKLEEIQRDIQKSQCMDLLSLYSTDEMTGGASKIMSDDCSHYILLKKNAGTLNVGKAIEESLEKASGSGLFSTENQKQTRSMKQEVDLFSYEESVFDADDPEILLEDECKDSEMGEKFVANIEYEDKNKRHDHQKDTLVKAGEQDILANEHDALVNEDEQNVRKDENGNEGSISVKEKTNNADCDPNISTNIQVPSNNCDTVDSDKESPEVIGVINIKSIDTHDEMKEDIQNDSSDSDSFEVVPDFTTVSTHQKISLKPSLNHEQYDNKNIFVDSMDQTLPSDSDVGKSHKAEEDMGQISDNYMEVSQNQNAYEESGISTLKDEILGIQLALQADLKEEIAVLQAQQAKVERQSNTAQEHMVQEIAVLQAQAKVENQAKTVQEIAVLQEQQAEVERQTNAAQEHMAQEIVELQAQQAKVERQANTVQEHMVQECKDLLRLFGVPYIVSPMEAEAQCAFYDLKEISHGTITDDSDIWLFGGKRVYKNFFAQKKYVEFYKDSEILSHFGLSRMKLINFGMLTGSDYTEGIEGVGRVTAMEIISEFSEDGLEALHEFKSWWKIVNKHSTPPKNKVCSKLLKLPLKDGFPNKHIFEAYLKPEVDESAESFSWGLPDLDSLRDYCREKFGWKKAKVDEALQPIIKRMSERMAQTHLDSFFQINLKKEKNLFPSKRIMSALKKINHQEDVDDPEPIKKNPRKKVVKEKRTRKTVSKVKTGMKKRKDIEIKQSLNLSEDSDAD